MLEGIDGVKYSPQEQRQYFHCYSKICIIFKYYICQSNATRWNQNGVQGLLLLSPIHIIRHQFGQLQYYRLTYYSQLQLTQDIIILQPLCLLDPVMHLHKTILQWKIFTWCYFHTFKKFAQTWILKHAENTGTFADRVFYLLSGLHSDLSASVLGSQQKVIKRLRKACHHHTVLQAPDRRAAWA